MIIFDFHTIYAGMNKGYFYAPIEELSEHFDVKSVKGGYSISVKYLGKTSTPDFNDLKKVCIYIFEDLRYIFFFYLSANKKAIIDIDGWLRNRLVIYKCEITEKEQRKGVTLLESVINNIENETSKR